MTVAAGGPIPVPTQQFCDQHWVLARARAAVPPRPARTRRARVVRAPREVARAPLAVRDATAAPPTRARAVRVDAHLRRMRGSPRWRPSETSALGSGPA